MIRYNYRAFTGIMLPVACATISSDGEMMQLPASSALPSSLPALATPTTHVLFW